MRKESAYNIFYMAFPIPKCMNRDNYENTLVDVANFRNDNLKK